MLKQVQGSLKRIGAWFIIALLIIAFAAFGINDSVTSVFSQPALKVGDASFNRQAIQRDFNRELTNRRLETGEALSPQEAVAQGIPEQVIAMITARAVLEQTAAQAGLAMPRNVVSEFLQSDTRFQNPATGKLDSNRLQTILQQYNMSVSEFENILRDDLLREQLVRALSTGPAASPPLVQALILRQTEERQISYVTVTEEMAGIAEEPTPEALREYYQRNSAVYQAPEYRTITAVIIRDADFTAALEADEDQLRQLYEANKARLYEKPERRTVYQITYDTQAEAEAAVAALNQQQPFEALAQDRGLTLPAVTATDVTKAEILNAGVADAVFAEGVDVGAIVGPVDGVFGYTVAQVAGVTSAEIQSFDEVRADLETQLLSRDARRLVFEAVEAVENAQDTGASLSEAATAANHEAQQFGPVDRFSFGTGGEIINRIPGEVLQEAFTLEEGETSQAIDLEDGTGYFFVQVGEVTPASTTPYELVEEQVEANWRQQERDSRIANAVSQIRSAVEDGATLADAASPLNRTPVTETITRQPDLNVFSEALVEQMFSANKGDLVSGPAGSGAAQIVAKIDDVVLNDNINPAQLVGLQQYLDYQLNQELLEAFISTKQQDLGVRRDQQQLDTVFLPEASCSVRLA